jgi:translation initiation factor 3 subunit L
MSENVDFKLPESISNWIFDLHDATRRSMRSEEVEPLYDVQYRELTEKFFAQTPWPHEKVIAPECNYDDTFLVFYNEMRARHLFTKLKPQLPDFIESWNNYMKVFDCILAPRGPDITLTTQWIHDIIVEFVYQFQGFCQYRCQVRNRTAEDLKVLDANRTIWILPVVIGTLRKLSSKASSTASVTEASDTLELFAYFASIEQARLECLLGDYRGALEVTEHIKLGDRSELYTKLPSCHVNLYYHTGVCQMMLRQYNEAIETFGAISLYVSRIMKPGAPSSLKSAQDQSTMKKMLDKILALLAICVCLLPGVKIDDQVRELVESKFSDKMRRLGLGEMNVFTDMFKNSCPRFISSALPDYGNMTNLVEEAYDNQVSVFKGEIRQHVAVLRLRSYLRLYASIDLAKLARFSDMTESDLVSLVLNYKHKLKESTFGVDYFVQDDLLIIDTVPTKVDKSKAAERYFVAGVRKHSDILTDLNRLKV